MRIVSLKATPVLLPIGAPTMWSLGGTAYFRRIIVQLHADNGLVGLGEMRAEKDRLAAIEAAKPLVLGKDPWQLEVLRMTLCSPPKAKVLGLNAYRVYAAIETACLDIQGQAVGKPVCELLGGPFRDRLPFAAYLYFRVPGPDGRGGIQTAAEMLGHAEDLVAKFGFRSVKLKGGVLSPDEEAEILLALSRKFPGMRVRIDPNAAWDIGTSIRVARKLVDCNLDYLEDPTHGIQGMARVNEKTPGVALATNMCVRSWEDLPFAVEQRPVDVILADPHEYGGLTALKQLWRFCEVFNFDVNLHSPTETGVALASYLHVAAALPCMGETYALDSHYHHLEDDVIAGGKLQYEGGMISVPKGPGLGVRLDEDKLQLYHELWCEKNGGGPTYVPRGRGLAG